MKRFNLNYNEQQIVRAIVREDARRGSSSNFNKRGASAIEKAKSDIDIGDASPDVRDTIIDKIYQSIAYSTAWEYLGETYCSRGTFYQHRKQFCYLIALNMGMINDKRKKQNKKGRT